MPRSTTVYRVFIGSPGGLEAEREQFYLAFEKFNAFQARFHDVEFEPVGWEDMLPGKGRPQAKINADLEQCDYAIFVFHNWWGSKTGNGDLVGTEEEWKIAQRLYADYKIRAVALYFKDIPAAQIKDPGDELRKVLAFKEKIFAEKQHLCGNFANAEQFGNEVEKHLAEWLTHHLKQSDANAFATLPEVPVNAFKRVPQDEEATAYGINDQQRLDRLPSTNQRHLRDTLDQRTIYSDIRIALSDFIKEGQRLGQRLERGLMRLLDSMPERFEDAEVYPIWRDGNTLRDINFEHLEATKSRDPDPARLDEGMAVRLGGVLRLYNLFSAGDDGLLERDQKAISFQERIRAEAEVAAAAPIMAAMLETPEILTEIVIDDIHAEQDAIQQPNHSPYAAQLLDQALRTTRNRVAALISAVGGYVLKASKVAGNDVRSGVVGLWIVDLATGTNSIAGLIKFIANKSSEFATYAQTVFSTYQFDWLWAALSGLF